MASSSRGLPKETSALACEMQVWTSSWRLSRVDCAGGTRPDSFAVARVATANVIMLRAPTNRALRIAHLGLATRLPFLNTNFLQFYFVGAQTYFPVFGKAS